MSDDIDDDFLDERLESLLRRAETFRELLREGDEITIGLFDGEVHVAESYRSKFERKHAKLFGRLLSIDAQLEPGWTAYMACMVVAATLIIGIHLRWFDSLFGEALGELLQTWWFYAPLAIAMIYLARQANSWYSSFTYRWHRQDLIDIMLVANLDRDLLLVMLRDEEELDNVIHQLKLDAGPFPTQAGIP
ncbi:MAG: hypothetical protein FJ303_04555 [Planctomycetes bacterium]|nr:hypothetical protein [Planctomycetota bacterium]